MAYKKCDWCEKSLNGFDNTRKHEEREHPQERVLREARLDVNRHTNYLAMAKLEIERLGDYLAAIEIPLLPPQVRLLVQRELDRYYHGEDTTRARLVWNVEYETSSLAEAQAWLAELEAKVPVAARP